MHISNKCSIAVHCLVFLSEYGEREKVTSELLSCSTGCNPVTIRNILSALKKDEIITVKPGTGGAALALPPEKIDLYRICSVVDRNIGNVLGKTYDTLKNNLIASMKTITLEQILSDYHEVLKREKN